MAYKGKIPFVSVSAANMSFVEGSLVGYPDRFCDDRGYYEWKNNYEARASMFIHTFGRGRSAAHFVLSDENGRTFQMFLTDLLNMIHGTKIENGWVHNGKWTFVKRGMNYGIQWIGDKTC